MSGKSVAVDLDGVLAAYDRWRGIEHVGDPIPGAREFLVDLRDAGFRVVIFTARLGDHPESFDARFAVVRDWLARHAMPHDELYIGRGKPAAAAYVDDRAVYCDPQRNRLAFLTARERVGALAAGWSTLCHDCWLELAACRCGGGEG